MTDDNPWAEAAAGSEAPDDAPATAERATAGAPGETSLAGETIDPSDHARVAAEYKDKLLRVLAEMENLRRRTAREIADTRTYGISAFARDILAVADNMDRALQALDVELREKADAGVKALLDGVELTERELHKALEKHGVKKFEPLGEKFDPNLHQAMFEIPDPSVPAGTVAQVVQPGYMIGERMLRPALVAVAKGGPKPTADTPANDNLGEASRDPQPSS
ncbi:MAG TPA: nucleotide exchange factor GrpE [Xanthobacteraceae bacterium]|jgi:molecular chaperone GrpE